MDMQSEMNSKPQTTSMPETMTRYSTVKPLDKRQIREIVDQVYSKDTDVITALIEKRLDELLCKRERDDGREGTADIGRTDESER